MTVRRSTAAVSGALALLLAASLAAGCGGESPPTPSDPTAAKGFLTQALDAWKGGKPKDSLTKEKPSILVNDPDWERKSKLTDYKVEGDGQALGAGVQWTVPLTLSVKGKTVEKKAVYVVNVAEAMVTVSRLDMDF
ncbi:MAG: hypothetical protein BGO49_11860 [Planctomycetales bacterium 71-10]|nr:MAG: hypothetical protein BGO49_11860 [Planctomycetales bacterium 71-10]